MIPTQKGWGFRLKKATCSGRKTLALDPLPRYAPRKRMTLPYHGRGPSIDRDLIGQVRW